VKDRLADGHLALPYTSMTIPLNALYEAADRDESAAVHALTGAMSLAQRARALEIGRALVRGVRTRAAERPYLDAFLQEFGLSNEEGIALMCLAEALPRIPDDANADLLIAEQLAGGDWAAHAGSSESLFVNASTWALMLTGRLIDLPAPMSANTSGWLRGLVQRAGEPVVRRALRAAMRLMGNGFVVGRDIGKALARSRRDDNLTLCSFDMLGEGARTDATAQRYFDEYTQGIRAIGEAAHHQNRGDADPHSVSSISIKLSALEPRYALAQRDRVRQRLIPRVLELARIAAHEDLTITIDAEEADRLEISLEVFEALARDATTQAWRGLGLAVQAYGRRAPAVVDWLCELAHSTGRHIAVRLVKGAYWDSEIKRAQERGLLNYPVYTRKVSTDIAYLACARQLFNAGQLIYPQFATHNAHTIGAIIALRPPGARFEFQRLHGMGQLIYDQARRTIDDFPRARVYAPVGRHEELLAYLVRRLLENGANTSFVNRFMDERVAPELIVADPFEQLAALECIPHPDLPLPSNIYGSARRNSPGADFGESRIIDALERAVATPPRLRRNGTATAFRPCAVRRVTNPADRRDCVGEISFATTKEIARAFDDAAKTQRHWSGVSADQRAACPERAACALEAQRDRFVWLLVRESGKTLADAIAEVREAADFCRYYAAEARRLFGLPSELPGPTGESNRLLLEGRGTFACISPWNFPLAIFTGQIAAALSAGNAVVAKPADHTPLIAAAMTDLLHEAGIPHKVLQCLPAEGRPFGDAALRHPALSGVVFTGSTTTAQWINRMLAARDGSILPLIAETGGLNAMIVDSTALHEQVIDDVVASAFSSAGQRCSALRLLCVQEDVADQLIEMLVGAMDEIVIGDPSSSETDIGPVISESAALSLMHHVATMRCDADILKACRLDERHAHGSFVAPHLIELRDPAQLTSEQFGPLLHVVRYRAAELDRLLAAIQDSGYALTLGVQTRLESTWRRVLDRTIAGNTYVNRNMIGAVVGVQPFGGSGLSGTGPKAGGPHYLARFARERTLTINTTATGGNAALLQLS
jgi:RHH-type transcriptional regulator, proline utilization regulon repressor / proline dehydrogenase / delta 1-pyrroline-5-carboxylate dehydrogenase